MVKKQAKVKTKKLMGKSTKEQAGIVVEINKAKVINQKADIQTVRIRVSLFYVFLFFGIIIFLVLFLVIIHCVYSPLYFVLVLSVSSFVSLCGHCSPVFCSPHSLIPFTCFHLVSSPPTPFMVFLPVMCPRCPLLFSRAFI